MLNVPGATCYHGVGKTFPAASNCYLSFNENGCIIFIYPPALININIVNSLKDHRHDIEDNRHSYKSFEQFTRNLIISNPKALILANEAHHIRTYIL